MDWKLISCNNELINKNYYEVRNAALETLENGLNLRFLADVLRSISTPVESQLCKTITLRSLINLQLKFMSLL